MLNSNIYKMDKHNKSMVKNKRGLLYILAFAMIFLIVSVSAQECKINTPINLQLTCTVADQIPSPSATYNISVYYPNGTSLVNNVQATSQSQGSFNYTLIHPISGMYTIKSFCYDTIGNYSSTEIYLCSPNGTSLNISDSILFGLIFILICAFLYGSIYGMQNAVNVQWQIFYICTTFLLFFSIFFVAWLFCDNYLWQTPILASIFWIIWLILSILFWPFIIGVSAYLLKKQAEELMVKEYVKQGYSSEDSRELAKRKR